MAELKDNQDPYTLIAVDGLETSADVRLGISVLGKMGLSPRVVREYEDILKNEEPVPSLYPIDDITGRDQFLGREHFLSFRERYIPALHGSVAGRVFYIATGQEIQQSMPSLRIVDREYTPLGQFLPGRYWSGASYLSYNMKRAIQVESFLRIKERLIDNSRFVAQPYGMGIKTTDFMREMAEFLDAKTILEPKDT